MELQPILHVWLNHDNDLVDLTITTVARPPLKAGQHSEVVHTTQKHPFLTIEKGFLPVGQLTLGMHVLRADGSIGTITGWKLVPGSATMYHLEVAQDHTYTVGDGLWVVHNCASGGDLFRGGNATESKLGRIREGVDVFPDENGLIHPGGGGVSIDLDREHLVQSGYTKPYKFSANDVPDALQIRNDHGTHALLEPAYPMTVDEFRGFLQQIPAVKDF